MKTSTHTFFDNKFVLSHLRGMYWEEANTLFIADTHLGKKDSPESMAIDLLRLTDLVNEFKAERLVILGDLFHNSYTGDWEVFRIWRNQFSHMKIQLIQGNHDIFPLQSYSNLDIELIPDYLEEAPFIFTHKPATGDVPSGTAIICGHVHPSVEINGETKKLPCFYFGASHSILPAFSEDTGTASIHPKKIDAIYALSDKDIYVFGNKINSEPGVTEVH